MTWIIGSNPPQQKFCWAVWMSTYLAGSRAVVVQINGDNSILALGVVLLVTVAVMSSK